MDVVQHDHDRLPRRGIRQEGSHAVEQAEARLVGFDRRGRWQIWQRPPDLRDDLGDCGGARAKCAFERALRNRIDEGADALKPRPIARGGGVAVRAAAAKNHRAGHLRVGRCFGGQARFADAGIARDDGDSAAARRCFVDRATQAIQLDAASHERAVWKRRLSRRPLAAELFEQRLGFFRRCRVQPFAQRAAAGFILLVKPHAIAALREDSHQRAVCLFVRGIDCERRTMVLQRRFGRGAQPGESRGFDAELQVTCA